MGVLGVGWRVSKGILERPFLDQNVTKMTEVGVLRIFLENDRLWAVPVKTDTPLSPKVHVQYFREYFRKYESTFESTFESIYLRSPYESTFKYESTFESTFVRKYLRRYFRKYNYFRIIATRG